MPTPITTGAQVIPAQRDDLLLGNPALRASVRPTYEPATGGDRKVNLGFGFSAAEEVNAMYDALVAPGAQGYFPPTSWNGGDIRYAIVVDPDDNQISLRWPLVS